VTEPILQPIPLKQSSNRRLLLARLAALFFVIAITIYIYSIRNQVQQLAQYDQLQQLAQYGYAGVFFLSILANATVLLPAPGILFVFAMGGVFNPAFVALAAGAGAALGEFSGYLAGFSGQAIVEKTAVYERLSQWMQRNGSLTILVLAFVPNPIFDVAGMLAGALRMKLHVFLFWCMIGKIMKMLLFAYAGSLSLKWLY